MRRMLEILAPENVYVEYELAGLGSRFAALIIDLLIQFGIMLVILISILIAGIDFVSVGDARDSVFIAVGIAVIFFIRFGYFTFFEMATQGQSPGKMVMKLRVIKRNGQPVGFYESLLRNVLRIADMLPAFNLLGAIFIVFSKNYMRIGDFAANTVVVKTGREARPVCLNRLFGNDDGQKGGNSQGHVKVSATHPNIYPVNNIEYSILKEFLLRKENLGQRRPVIAYRLNMYFMKKFNIEKPYTDPYSFFEEILRISSGT